MTARRYPLAFLGLSLVAAASHGCGGPTYVVQQYPGEVRSRDTIAVIRVNGGDSVLLDSLDGENIGVQVAEDAKLYVEVLPGPHRVGIVNASEGGPAKQAAFSAEAGKFYRPVFTTSARIYEVDSDSDKLIRDVTIEAPAAAPTSAPPLETAAAPAPEAPAPTGPVRDGGMDAGSDAMPPATAP